MNISKNYFKLLHFFELLHFFQLLHILHFLQEVVTMIQSFLKKRKYRVVANGEISEEQDVISGVPQGTVLASILFIIMIYDIDEDVRNSIMRLFADDTKISAR